MYYLIPKIEYFIGSKTS